jgi:hypothetical protein
MIIVEDPQRHPRGFTIRTVALGIDVPQAEGFRGVKSRVRKVVRGYKRPTEHIETVQRVRVRP